jgi:hypothetical protein
MRLTASELFDLYQSLLLRDSLKREIDAAISDRREAHGVCLFCGEDCTCADERADEQNARARQERAA